MFDRNISHTAQRLVQVTATHGLRNQGVNSFFKMACRKPAPCRSRWILLALCIVMLAGCAKGATPQGPGGLAAESSASQSPDASVAGTSADLDSDGSNPATDGRQPVLTAEEQEAIALKLVPETWADSLQESVSAKAFIRLVTSCAAANGVAEWTHSFDELIPDTAAPIDRSDAALVLYVAALETLHGVEDASKPWEIDAMKHLLEGMAVVLPAGQTKGYTTVEAERFCTAGEDVLLGGKGWNFEALTYVTLAGERERGVPLMETTEDGLFRATDLLTRSEAMHALVRFHRLYQAVSQPVWTPLEKVPIAELDEEILALAQTMPDVSRTSFDFHGVNVSVKEHAGLYHGIPALFYEEQIDLVSHMGFNFIRVPIWPEGSFSTDKKQVDLRHMENLDDLIAWSMERQIHVCIDLHEWGDGQGTYDEAFLHDFWHMMAVRYQAVSPRAVSFNILNEPSGTPSDIARMNRVGMAAVHAVTPDRLVFCDGQEGNYNEGDGIAGVAMMPSSKLANDPVAQSFHWYAGVFNGGTSFEMGTGDLLRAWPYPFVSSQVLDGYPMTLSGSFVAGEQLDIQMTFITEGVPLEVVLDGTVIHSELLVDPSQTIRVTVPQDGSEIRLSVSSGWCKVGKILIHHLDPAPEGVPMYEKGGYWYGKAVAERFDHRVTEILCDGSTIDPQMSSHVTLMPDGGYTATTSGKRPAYVRDYGPEGMRAFVQLWRNHREKTGQQVMCQEFGFYCSSASNELHVAYLEDWLSVLDEADIPWSSWDWERLVTRWKPSGDDLDTTWTKHGDFYINQDLLDVYQRHMK